ncbi:MAG: pyruvate dehydrogenase complex dihydrolipoamide acetyltransferase [Rhodospirillaceae bacterium]|nr:pyruvate dehydrogenase complex dihydrolipoamide acetyltransferase [Rhodospirillaceae bacterium]
MPLKITMPALSPTMTEGTLAKWLVGEGDTVQSGDVIAEIETDKATMEVEAVDEGIIGRLLVDAGSEGVPVNAVIALLLEDGEDATALDSVDVGSAGPGPAPTPSQQPAAAQPVATAPAPTPAAESGDRVFASPLARRMASQAGLELSGVTGTGPNGRIVKRDVEAAIASPGAQAVAPSAAPVASAAPVPADASPFEPAFDLDPASTMRKVIAARLSESKQTVPHFYLTVDCEIDELLKIRKDLNARSDDYKISVNDMIIKACGIALRKVPEANASWTGDALKIYKTADIAVAVAIDGGLITPVVRDAGGKGLETISNEMRELGAKAKDGKLMPEEFQGGTFSISNLGMYGVKQFDAVINPPQGAIMAVGAGEPRPVVKDGALAVATVMSVTLSVDHRAVDGAVGARFLAAFKALIENPLTMLL